MTTSPLLSLPTEIQVEIISYLDYKSLVQCRMTCRTWLQIIDDSSALRYILELSMDGLKDSGSTSLSHCERLLQLRQWRRGWMLLDCSTFCTVPIGSECQAYELVGGTFSKSNGRDFLVVWLPNARNEIQTIYRPDLGLRLRDFAVDPTQDLLAILERDQGGTSYSVARTVNLHLRSISANEAHPSAKTPILNFVIPPDPRFGNNLFNAAMQLADDVLGLFFFIAPELTEARVILWNWKSGRLLYDSVNTPLPKDTWDFSLLSPEAFILTSVEGTGSFHLYHLPENPTASAVPIATFNLPPLKSEYRMGSLSIHSSPIHSQSLPGSLFMTVPESFVQVVSLRYFIDAMAGSIVNFSMFVHSRFFLRYIQAYKGGRADFQLGQAFEWDSWGPHNTRFLPRRIPHNWLRYVHGQRVVCANPSKGVDILDFNFADHLTGLITGETFPRSRPTALFSDVFASPVLSYLPYYQQTRPIANNFYAYMIDEDRVIGLKTNFLNDPETMELHVYGLGH